MRQKPFGVLQAMVARCVWTERRSDFSEDFGIRSPESPILQKPVRKIVVNLLSKAGLDQIVDRQQPWPAANGRAEARGSTITLVLPDEVMGVLQYGKS